MSAAFVFEKGRGPSVLLPLIQLYGLCKKASSLLDTRVELLFQHSLKEDKFALMVTVRKKGVSSILFGHYDDSPIKAIGKMTKELEEYLEDSRTEGKSAPRKKSRTGARGKNSARKRSNGLRQGRCEGDG